MAWLLLPLSWLLPGPAQARGWGLISIPSQALPRWLSRTARLGRLRAPRCPQILPALTAHSALLGQQPGPNTAPEFGRAGQGRIPRGDFLSPAARQMGWAVGEEDGPSGPSALPEHTKEPPPLALCGLVATLWWGKAWEGWEAKLCQLSHPHLCQSRLGRGATPACSLDGAGARRG